MTNKIPYACVRPGDSLDLLSQREVASLTTADQQTYQLFWRCALAVLNTGGETDDARQIYERYKDFEIKVVPESRGLKLELFNAPAAAFVDEVMIQGIRNHLFTALRDIVFTHHKLVDPQRFDLETGSGITDAVFRILRNARIVQANLPPKLVVCWGGHAISRVEYDFSKEVGYQLGLRHMDIATGCGAGAMKGPMKGAAVGHAKQYNKQCRYVGITEPGIIASESPNPIVNELVILPDVEKRLESFVRLAHGIVIFPGGVGTTEEILYLLGLKLQPENAAIPLPVILAAPESSAAYFREIDRFVRATLGAEAAAHYQIICGDAAAVASSMRKSLDQVHRHRRKQQESYSFNWELSIPEDFQRPFIPTHESMAALHLRRPQPAHQLAAELRRTFSGIVTGNVKECGVRAVEEHGPYQLRGDAELLGQLDTLLQAFVSQGRMTFDSEHYQPCYQLQD